MKDGPIHNHLIEPGTIIAEPIVDFESLNNKRACFFYENGTNAIFDSGKPYMNYRRQGL